MNDDTPLTKEEQARWEAIQAEINRPPGFIERVVGGTLFYGFVMVPVPIFVGAAAAYLLGAEFTIATYVISAIIVGALFGAPK